MTINNNITKDGKDKENDKASYEKIVDYLSIDTEGSEYNVLKGVDFSRHKIRYISVESNYQDTRIQTLLESNNFKLLCIIGGGEYIYGNTTI